MIKTGAHALMQFEYGIWFVTWFVIMLVKDILFISAYLGISTAFVQSIP